MSKRGEIYEIPYKSIKRYFQLVAFDETQLNSDVIAVFNYRAKPDEKPSIDDIVDSGVEFFVHTTVNAGVRQELWHKIGKAEIVDYSEALFKEIYDEDGMPTVEPDADSYHSWIIWHVNGDWQQIGDRVDEYPEAQLGSVYSPSSILYRIEIGRHYGAPYYGQVK